MWPAASYISLNHLYWKKKSNFWSLSNTLLFNYYDCIKGRKSHFYRTHAFNLKSIYLINQGNRDTRSVFIIFFTNRWQTPPPLFKGLPKGQTGTEVYQLWWFIYLLKKSHCIATLEGWNPCFSRKGPTPKPVISTKIVLTVHEQYKKNNA